MKDGVRRVRRVHPPAGHRAARVLGLRRGADRGVPGRQAVGGAGPGGRGDRRRHPVSDRPVRRGSAGRQHADHRAAGAGAAAAVLRPARRSGRPDRGRAGDRRGAGSVGDRHGGHHGRAGRVPQQWWSDGPHPGPGGVRRDCGRTGRRHGRGGRRRADRGHLPAGRASAGSCGSARGPIRTRGSRWRGSAGSSTACSIRSTSSRAGSARSARTRSSRFARSFRGRCPICSRTSRTQGDLRR